MTGALIIAASAPWPRDACTVWVPGDLAPLRGSPPPDPLPYSDTSTSQPLGLIERL